MSKQRQRQRQRMTTKGGFDVINIVNSQQSKQKDRLIGRLVVLGYRAPKVRSVDTDLFEACCDALDVMDADNRQLAKIIEQLEENQNAKTNK